MQVRMIRNERVAGINRRAGDFVDTSDVIAKRLIDSGAASGVCGEAPKPNVTPNRMKFASLVAKLDPHAEDFAEKVARLQQDCESRSGLIDNLVKAYTEGEVEDAVYRVLGGDRGDLDAARALDDVIRAAIERFVVDRY